MKKYLLGALFILGAMSYAQDNKVIVPVVGENATANLGIEVTGKVFDPADLSLVVDIKSAASANGTGFAFTMPNMFAKKEVSKTVQGDFDVYVEKDGAKVPFDQDLKINLVKGTQAAEKQNSTLNDTVAGNVGEITLDYSLIGGDGAGTQGKVMHNGGVVVKATTTGQTKAGTYSDTSVQLRVELESQRTQQLP